MYISIATILGVIFFVWCIVNTSEKRNSMINGLESNVESLEDKILDKDVEIIEKEERIYELENKVSELEDIDVDRDVDRDVDKRVDIIEANVTPLYSYYCAISKMKFEGNISDCEFADRLLNLYKECELFKVELGILEDEYIPESLTSNLDNIISECSGYLSVYRDHGVFH